MATPIFSHHVRTLLCENCGGVLDAPMAGGLIPCRFCKANNRLVQRDESADLSRAQRAVDMPESARLENLRQQDHRPLVPPPSVQRHLSGGQLPPQAQQGALQDWLGVRGRLMVDQSVVDAEHLFHLTWVLAPELEGRRRRALLENACDVLSDARYRQMLRCELVHLAVLHRTRGPSPWITSSLEPTFQHPRSLPYVPPRTWPTGSMPD